MGPMDAMRREQLKESQHVNQLQQTMKINQHYQILNLAQNQNLQQVLIDRNMINLMSKEPYYNIVPSGNSSSQTNMRSKIFSEQETMSLSPIKDDINGGTVAGQTFPQPNNNGDFDHIRELLNDSPQHLTAGYIPFSKSGKTILDHSPLRNSATIPHHIQMQLRQDGKDEQLRIHTPDIVSRPLKSKLHTRLTPMGNLPQISQTQGQSTTNLAQNWMGMMSNTQPIIQSIPNARLAQTSLPTNNRANGNLIPNLQSNPQFDPYQVQQQPTTVQKVRPSPQVVSTPLSSNKISVSIPSISQSAAANSLLTQQQTKDKPDQINPHTAAGAAALAAIVSTNQQTQNAQELVRNVQARVEDIFHVRQIVDVKQKKMKSTQNVYSQWEKTFGEIKNRELHRVNKENAILQRFLQGGRIEDRLLKKQIQRSCKRIQKAFRGVIEEDELNYDLEKEIQKSELHLNDIHGEGPLPRKILYNLTGKNKLIDAAFKEKEMDPHFCLAYVISLARSNFMSEMSRAFETYIEACDNQNSVLVIKRIFKNMKDNNQQRQLKIAKEIKIIVVEQKLEFLFHIFQQQFELKAKQHRQISTAFEAPYMIQGREDRYSTLRVLQSPSNLGLLTRF